MRLATLTALVGTTAILTSPAIGQQQTQPQQQAAKGSCAQLVQQLEQRQDTQQTRTTPQQQGAKPKQQQDPAAQQQQPRPGQQVTLQQARQWQQANNEKACAEALQRLAQAGPDAGQDQAQAAPEISVRQPMPEIIVRQAPPTITVEQPQPEIIVSMPKPQVDIQVPADQQTTAQQVHENGQPQVRFEETGEPKVQFRRAEGQPKIRYEQMKDQQAAAQQQPTAQDKAAPQREAQQQQPTAKQKPDAQQVSVTVDRLEGMNVNNAQGNNLGTVDEVVMDAKQQVHVIISYGGFLGIGDRRVSMPSDRVLLQGDRLIVPGMTDDQLRELPEYKQQAGIKPLPSKQQVTIAQTKAGTVGEGAR